MWLINSIGAVTLKWGKTYLSRSGTTFPISTFDFFFEWDSCTGDTLGSEPEAGGELLPVLEQDKLPARFRISTNGPTGPIVNDGLELRLRRFFFFAIPVSISSIRPNILAVGGGGIQSRSFFRWPRPHLKKTKESFQAKCTKRFSIIWFRWYKSIELKKNKFAVE